jgi:uncharacterized protein
MIALDTNILVYALRKEPPFHGSGFAVLKGIAESEEPWAIPWPCVHEFLATVTNPKAFKEPTPTSVALDQIADLARSGTLVFLGEEPGYWEVLDRLARERKIHGGKFHDARIAALCILHQVDELLTADRDFSRFPELRCRNPL